MYTAQDSGLGLKRRVRWRRMHGESSAARTFRDISRGDVPLTSCFLSLSVQQVMQDMDRMLAKGEIPEEEMRALEMDVTGKIMLASWRGTRFEVVQVLREVSFMKVSTQARNSDCVFPRWWTTF